MAELGTRPLSDTLGLPDVFPHAAVRRWRGCVAMLACPHQLVCVHSIPELGQRSDSQTACCRCPLLPHPPPQECAEDRLTPEVLAHGYRHSEAAAVGLTPQRELALTLTDQPAGFYSAASLAYWRKVSRLCRVACPGLSGSPARVGASLPQAPKRATCRLPHTHAHS